MLSTCLEKINKTIVACDSKQTKKKHVFKESGKKLKVITASDDILFCESSIYEGLHPIYTDMCDYTYI